MQSINRRKFLKSSLKAGALLCLGTFNYSLFHESKSVEIKRLDIKIKNLPEDFENLTITQISDLHSGRIVDFEVIKKSVKMVNELDSDIVMITGDFIEHSYYREEHIRPCMQELALIQPKDGVFAVLGNHDHKIDPEKITAELQRVGTCVLRNENKRLRRGDSSIQILGVDDLVLEKDDIKKTLDGVSAHEVKILMSHSPDIAENYNLSGIDLILSGHTHGGQICCPLIGAPQTRIASAYGQKYISGLVQYNDIQIYVNRGIGASFLPARFLCKPEITVFTLKGV